MEGIETIESIASRAVSATMWPVERRERYLALAAECLKRYAVCGSDYDRGVKHQKMAHAMAAALENPAELAMWLETIK